MYKYLARLLVFLSIVSHNAIADDSKSSKEEYQKIEEEVLKDLDPNIQAEIQSFKEEVAKMNEARSNLYKNLSQEAKDAMKQMRTKKKEHFKARKKNIKERKVEK